MGWKAETAISLSALAGALWAVRGESYWWAAFLAYVVQYYARMVWVTYDSGGVDGPLSVPLIGNLQLFTEFSALHLDAAWRVSTYPLGQYRSVVGSAVQFVLSEPADVKILLSTRFEAADRSWLEVERLDEFLGGGLILAPNGERWARGRRAFHEVFRHENTLGLLPHFARKARDLNGVLGACADSGQALPLFPLMLKLTFDGICHAAFGRDFGCLQPVPAGHRAGDALERPGGPEPPALAAFEFILSHSLLRFFGPSASVFRLLTPGRERRYAESLGLLRGVIREQIAEARARAGGSLGGGGGGDRVDLLAHAIRLQERGDAASALTDDELVQHCMTLVFAGHDTTANALSWLFFFLATHPECERRVREELEAAAAAAAAGDEAGAEEDRGEAEAEAEALRGRLGGLEYLHMCVKETLRLRPSAPIRGRTLKDEVQFTNCRLRAGSTVVWGAAITHSLPHVWREPGAFVPERFARNSEWRVKDPFAYVPFGAGRRRCIGEDLALTEIKAVASMVLSRYRFSLAEPLDRYASHANITMFPSNGMPMLVHRLRK